MVKFNCSIKAAVANHSEAMETRGYFKNGANSKSHKSRGFFMQFIIWIMFVFPLLLVSCEKNRMDDFTVTDGYRINNVTYAKGSLLKRVYQSSDNNKILYSTYKYDESGRISRIDYANKNYGYDTYLYNANEMLEEILKYVENPLTLTSSVVISYDDEGNKIQEQTFSHTGMLGVNRLYEYTDKKLIREEIVVDGQSPQIIFYEYEGDKVMKIKYGLKVIANFYDKDLLIRSITYIESSPQFIEGETKYYYDRNDNLIKKAIDSAISSASSLYTGPYFDSWIYEYD